MIMEWAFWEVTFINETAKSIHVSQSQMPTYLTRRIAGLVNYLRNTNVIGEDGLIPGHDL